MVYEVSRRKQRPFIYSEILQAWVLWDLHRSTGEVGFRDLPMATSFLRVCFRPNESLSYPGTERHMP